MIINMTLVQAYRHLTSLFTDTYVLEFFWTKKGHLYILLGVEWG